jgi:hypothetical protein
MGTGARFLEPTVYDPSMTRRSSLGVPASALIFPRSAEDRSESNKLTKAMEEKYGFHYFTNAFCLAPLLEMDYRAYYNETNLLPALYASSAAWICWVFMSVTDFMGLYDESAEARRLSQLHLIVGIFVFIPVPVLIACCRAERFHGREQTLLCAIVHCFGSVIMANGVLASSDVYTSFLIRDVEYLMDEAVASVGTVNSSNTLTALGNVTLRLDGDISWWDYEDLEGSARTVVLQYIKLGKVGACCERPRLGLTLWCAQ